MSSRASLLCAVAASVLLTSGLSTSRALAHAALVRGLATAAEQTALLIPGFGAVFTSASGESHGFVCDAELGTTPFAEPQHLVSLGDAGWLLADAAGLHHVSVSGCEATAPSGIPAGRAVLALAVAPGAERTLYAADDESWLYRSDDAGATWRSLMQLSSALPVTGLVIAGGRPLRIYVSQSGDGEARLSWSLDAGATFEAADLPGGPSLVSLRAVASDDVDRLWLSASDEAARDVAIWRMVAGGDPVTMHRVRFFGGLTLGDGAVWVGDEAGGLYRSERDEPFRMLQPDLAVSCLHHDGAGSLWVCTPATSDRNAVLVSDDRGESLLPWLALQEVQTLVECPSLAADRCASAWNDWQADVLNRAANSYVAPADAGEAATRVPEPEHTPRSSCSASPRRTPASPLVMGLALLAAIIRRRRDRARASGTMPESDKMLPMRPSMAAATSQATQR